MQISEGLDQLTLLELFGVEPCATNLAEGYLCYEVIDNSGTHLRFNIDPINQLVQIELENFWAKKLPTMVLILKFDAFDIIDIEKGMFALNVVSDSADKYLKVQIELRPCVKIERSILEM
jgi:hypothetical protein